MVGPPLVRLGTVGTVSLPYQATQVRGLLWRVAVAQPNAPNPSNHAESNPPILGAVARLYWMLGGNAALSLLAIGIAQQGPERIWIADAVFWAVAASLSLVRYLDIALLGGATASGEPASFGDWSRYTWRLLLVTLVVWIVAQVVRAGLEISRARLLASCSCD